MCYAAVIVTFHPAKRCGGVNAKRRIFVYALYIQECLVIRRAIIKIYVYTYIIIRVILCTTRSISDESSRPRLNHRLLQYYVRFIYIYKSVYLYRNVAAPV